MHRGYDNVLKTLRESYKKVEEGLFGGGGPASRLRQAFKKAAKDRNSKLQADGASTRYSDVGWAYHNHNPNIFEIPLSTGKDSRGKDTVITLRFMIGDRGVHVTPELGKSGWITFRSAMDVLEEALKLEKWDRKAYEILSAYAETIDY